MNKKFRKVVEYEGGTSPLWLVGGFIFVVIAQGFMDLSMWREIVIGLMFVIAMFFFQEHEFPTRKVHWEEIKYVKGRSNE